MDYDKLLEDYAKENQIEIINNRLYVEEDIYAWIENNSIRIRDERKEDWIYELPSEENPYEDKSKGIFYSVETEDFYSSLEDIISYVKSGKYLNGNKKIK